jgi:peptidoglycan/LPS O-acetylase OafA/YrhL
LRLGGATSDRIVGRARLYEGVIVPPQTAQRFALVDALRGIAALWIVVFHVFAGKQLTKLEVLLPSWTMSVVNMSYLGVTVFFVLSGFVIAHSLPRQSADASSVGWFVLRRSVRLGPPYWASLVLTIVIMRAGIPSFGVLLAHVFYLQDLLGLKPLSPVYWTLCLEIQLYLVFAVLLAIAHRFSSNSTDRRSLLIIFTGAALVAAAFPLGLCPEAILPAGLFLPRWYTFLLGAFACWAIDGTIPRSAFCLYAAALVAGAVHLGDADAVVAVLTSVLLLAVGRTTGKLREQLNWRPLLFLGLTSYSLYLVHNAVAAVALGVLRRVTPDTASWEFLWLLVVLVSSGIAAWIFWRLTERPCITLSRTLRPSTSPT